MKADVYRNLNKGDKFSVKSREEEQYGQVVEYIDFFTMSPAEFVVQDSGYDRYQETGHKNVHAFVRGEIKQKAVKLPSLMFGRNIVKDIFDMNRIKYNPDHADNFYMESCGKNYLPVTEAEKVIGLLGRIFAKNTDV